MLILVWGQKHLFLLDFNKHFFKETRPFRAGFFEEKESGPIFLWV